MVMEVGGQAIKITHVKPWRDLIAKHTAISPHDVFTHALPEVSRHLRAMPPSVASTRTALVSLKW